MNVDPTTTDSNETPENSNDAKTDEGITISKEASLVFVNQSEELMKAL